MITALPHFGHLSSQTRSFSSTLGKVETSLSSALTSSVGSSTPPLLRKYSPLKERERGILYTSIRLLFPIENLNGIH